MRKCFISLLLLLAIAPSIGYGGEAKRIAYFEAGQFWLFEQTYQAIQAALANKTEMTFSYPQEIHFSPGWEASPKELDAISGALLERDDVDVIIAAGTAAVRSLLRQNNGRIPIIGISIADPISAGIVKSPDDSGIDNLTCEVIVDRWKQMIRVFHDVVGFAKLGIIYPAGDEGRQYSALDDVLAVAQELGFQVLAREIPDETVPSCEAGLKWLHENGADAFFIGPLICFDWELGDPAALLNQLNRVYKMPTFARDGSLFVQGGALMGFATWDFAQSGERFADKIVKILAGASPRSLSMRAYMEPLIAVNLQTASELGFDLPFDVLIAADEIYATTSKPDIK